MTVRELGHLVLYVRDVRRSADFYRDVLGWRQILPEPGQEPVGAAAFSSGRTHHELLLIEVGAGRHADPPRPPGRAVPLRPQRRRQRRRPAGGTGCRRRRRRDGRRRIRSHRDPQPLHPRPRRQRDRAVHRRAGRGLADRPRTRGAPPSTARRSEPRPAGAARRNGPTDGDCARRRCRSPGGGRSPAGGGRGHRADRHGLRAGGAARRTPTRCGRSSGPRADPSGMHLPVLAASVGAGARTSAWPSRPRADALARSWWPGPLTLAFGFDDGRRQAVVAGRP